MAISSLWRHILLRGGTYSESLTSTLPSAQIRIVALDANGAKPKAKRELLFTSAGRCSERSIEDATERTLGFVALDAMAARRGADRAAAAAC